MYEFIQNTEEFHTPYPKKFELMRMWMVNPKMLCHQHLLGEHRELHAIVGSLRIGNSIQGYIDNNLVEVKNVLKRHKILVKEMKVRGYKHHSPIEEDLNTDYLTEEQLNFEVNRESSFNDLYSRCQMCAWRSYLFYSSWYDLLDAFYIDTVTVFKNSNDIWGLNLRNIEI